MNELITDTGDHRHSAIMRVLTGLCLTLFTFGCSDQPEVHPVEKIEIRASGLDIFMDAKDEGSFVFSPNGHYRQSGTFDVGPIGFDSLLNELSPYQRDSGPTAETSRRFLDSDCPDHSPYVTENGMISVRWIGPLLDQILIVDLGCDYEYFAERNRKIRDIISSLPVPEPVPLP